MLEPTTLAAGGQGSVLPKVTVSSRLGELHMGPSLTVRCWNQQPWLPGAKGLFLPKVTVSSRPLLGLSDIGFGVITVICWVLSRSALTVLMMLIHGSSCFQVRPAADYLASPHDGVLRVQVQLHLEGAYGRVPSQRLAG